MTPVEVEDWAFRPCHSLLEGAVEIELVDEDPMLSVEHRASLGCEGERAGVPERAAMLRHGPSYVVAARFDAAWRSPLR